MVISWNTSLPREGLVGDGETVLLVRSLIGCGYKNDSSFRLKKINIASVSYVGELDGKNSLGGFRVADFDLVTIC
jgi:hypothetical protein